MTHQPLPPPLSLGRRLERPFQLACIGLVRGYQIAISPLLPPACRFHPSCSQYAIDALRQRRLFAALGLTVWRLFRCNPLCKGGYDPVKPAPGVENGK